MDNGVSKAHSNHGAGDHTSCEARIYILLLSDSKPKWPGSATGRCSGGPGRQLGRLIVTNGGAGVRWGAGWGAGVLGACVLGCVATSWAAKPRKYCAQQKRAGARQRAVAPAHNSSVCARRRAGLRAGRWRRDSAGGGQGNGFMVEARLVRAPEFLRERLASTT